MSTPRIMIVEDYPPNVQLTVFVLEAAGFTVEAAGTAMQALARIPEFDPQLVLMDIQLPGMDGLALTRILKSDPATRHIRIAAFTAYAMRGDEAVMRAAGCDGYITKPIEVATMAASVRALLADAKPRSAG